MTLDDINDFQIEDLKKIGSAPTPIKLLAVVVISITVCALGYFFVVKDQIQKLDNSRKQELTLKQDFERKQAKASNLSAYETQLEEMEATFGSMLKSLPDKAEVESLLVEISRAGSANNLIINQFKPAGETPKEFYAEYPINMSLVGTYGEMTGFISDVAALQRIVTLHDVKITPVEGGENARADFIAKTYRYLSDEDE